MAKINVEIDTEAGNISVSVDGENISGEVDFVSIYRYKMYDKNSVEVDIQLRPEDYKTFKKITRYITSHAAVAKAYDLSKAERLGDLYKIDVDDSVSEQTFWK